MSKVVFDVRLQGSLQIARRVSLGSAGCNAERLERIETMLVVLVERQQVREWYSAEEFAHIVGRAEFTCREWCRHGRIKTEKKEKREGLLPAK